MYVAHPVNGARFTVYESTEYSHVDGQDCQLSATAISAAIKQAQIVTVLILVCNMTIQPVLNVGVV